MNYFEFMTARYQKKLSPAGDLARDMQEDPFFPELSGSDLCSDRKKIVQHLNNHGACSGCLEAFRYTWNRYLSVTRKQM